MNKDVKDIRFNMDLATFVAVYRQYKDLLLPVGIIVVAVVLFFLVLIPQVQGVLTAKEEERQEAIKLESLKQSYNVLSAMNEEALLEDNQNLDSALPGKKDFAGIINSISSNGVRAGVSVGNFEFNVGNLNPGQEVQIPYPSIQISLNVVGSSKATLDFIKSLYDSVPIAEVTSVKLSGDSTALKALFYYKSYPQANLQDATNVVQFTKVDTDLIAKVNKWASSVSSDLLPISLGTSGESSGSARTNPFE